MSLLTQEAEYGHHGANSGPAHLHDVNHCLRELRHFIDKEGIKSLALPKLATTAGRLDWKDVQPLIREHLGSVAIPVFLYTTYAAGVAANEPST